ncbi:MAG: phosphoribosylformylglycinamidine synthase subunit PurQ [Alphaproteobacteria bacterium]|nr:phosphoribosylformylglycinamidine synthase subunit PurQ [Alphaproteobacteria bacterium]
MRSAVIVFPASNCDRDAAVALTQVTGQEPSMVWHADNELPDVDLVVLPGGFSYGDYLRCGAMASQSRVMREVRERAEDGMAVLGICNGFQILTEAGLLPGALMRNAGLQYVCRPVALEVRETQSAFTRKYEHNQRVVFPVAHGEGNYFADDETLDRLEGEGRVLFRYATGDNPNGSVRDIAGIVNEKRNVLGLMPHPERAMESVLGGSDGRALFESLLEALG